MTDQELRDLVANTAIIVQNLAIQSAKTDEQLAKTDAQLAKTDAKLNKLAKLFGDVNNNRGEMAEEFFFTEFKEKAHHCGH